MVKLYFLQRLGRYSDQDPSLKLMLLAAIFVAMQIIGPLLVLAIFAADHKSLTICFALGIISVNWCVLRFRFYNNKEKQILKKENMNDIGHDPEIYSKRRKQEHHSLIFTTAIFTSWICTLTLWNHSKENKSSFLKTSCLCSLATLLCGIIFQCILCYFAIFEFNYHSAPITHCFSVNNSNEIINRYLLREWSDFSMEMCHSFFCKKVVRLCAENENPYDVFIWKVFPLCVVLLAMSLVGSAVLFYFGSYENVYTFSKKFQKPIVHQSYLQDVLGKRTELPTSINLKHFISEAHKSDNNIFNKKDPLYGETCLHTAAKNKLFDELKKMVQLGGDLSLKNNYGKNVYQYLNKYCKSRKDFKILKSTLAEIENPDLDDIIHVKIDKGMDTEYDFKWLKQTIDEKLKSLPYSESEKNSFLVLQLDKVEISNADESQELEEIVSLMSNSDDIVNVSRSEITRLHVAAANGNLEYMRFLIDKNTVNEIDKDGKTALHHAASHSHSLCVELLVQEGADVLTEDYKRKSPLDVVGLQSIHTNEITKEEEEDIKTYLRGKLQLKLLT